MKFNRQDILAAYFYFGYLYHTGQDTKEYGYILRSLEAGFLPSKTMVYDDLSNNAKKIYRSLTSKLCGTGTLVQDFLDLN